RRTLAGWGPRADSHHNLAESHAHLVEEVAIRGVILLQLLLCCLLIDVALELYERGPRVADLSLVLSRLAPVIGEGLPLSPQAGRQGRHVLVQLHRLELRTVLAQMLAQ